MVGKVVGRRQDYIYNYKRGIKKGAWTVEEDLKLSTFIQQHGHGNWQALPSKAGLQRCGKSCRLRWTNYLRPDIKRGDFSLQEDQTIIQLHALLGNKWSVIASHLSNRTDNEIKNYWNTYLKKKLTKMGIDPVTHKPIDHALRCGQPKYFANLCHMAQWESTRLEAEARLLRETKTTAAIPQPNHIDMSNAILNGFLDSDWALDQSQISMFNTNNHHNDMQGILGDLTELHQITETMTSDANYSGLPDLVTGFNDLYTRWNVLECGYVNYWGGP